MATTEELLYSIQSKAQLAAINAAIDALGDMADAVDDMGDEVADSNKKVEDLNDDLKETISFGSKMKGALGGIGGIAGKIGGGIGSIAGLIGAANTATQDWALKVEALSSSMAIGLEEASALAVGWERAGFDAEDVMGKFGQIQGRLIMELDAQKKAQEDLAEIHKERIELVEEQGEAEVEFQKTIANLEKERAEVNGANVAERRQIASKEIEDLKEDYRQFVEEQEEMEREETNTFEKIWEERARKFQESAEKLRDKFSADARKSRNFREFSEATKNFQEQRKQLVDNLDKDNKEQENAQDKRVVDRAKANDQERVLIEEKSTAIAEAADKDVAKLEEANQKQIVQLNERIEEEKAAYVDGTEAFQETLGELDKTAQTVANTGGDLTSVFNKLGVEIFDSEGKMRPFNDIIWDLQEGFGAMEDSGEKAALIADLGMEDIAPILTRGAGRYESLAFAQEHNLEVTEDSLAAVLEQRQAFIDAKLELIGYASSLGIAEKTNFALKFSIESIHQALEIGGKLWDQTRVIGVLLWEKFLEGVENTKKSLAELMETASETFKAVKEATGFGESGFFTQAGDLLGFQQGTRSVGGTEPQLAVVHPGEEIRTSAAVTANGSGGSGGGLTVNINAPVYGVQDLNNAIQGAVRQYDQGAFSSA